MHFILTRVRHSVEQVSNYATACVCLYDTSMLASMICLWATIRGLSLLVTTSPSSVLLMLPISHTSVQVCHFAVSYRKNLGQPETPTQLALGLRSQALPSHNTLPFLHRARGAPSGHCARTSNSTASSLLHWPLSAHDSGIRQSTLVCVRAHEFRAV
jgi:hypothetical protein